MAAACAAARGEGHRRPRRGRAVSLGGRCAGDRDGRRGGWVQLVFRFAVRRLPQCSGARVPRVGRCAVDARRCAVSVRLWRKSGLRAWRVELAARDEEHRAALRELAEVSP